MNSAPLSSNRRNSTRVPWSRPPLNTLGVALLLVLGQSWSACSRAAEITEPKSSPAPADSMVWIPGGTFQMGSDDGHPDEKPRHEVTVSGFFIDRTEVTNEAYDTFVRATGYVTVAERALDE